MSQPPPQALAGRTVVITGGSRGIGLATARAFLEAGARVAICAQDPIRLDAAERTLREEGGGEVFAQRVDVSDYRALEGFLADVEARLGAIDILVNNAGRAWSGRLAEQPRARIDALVDTNIKGVLYATRLVLPAMLARGAGVIVNVASGAGLAGFAQLVVYSCTKFAVVGFTEALAAELSATAVRVYAVCPGRVDTDMQREYAGRRIGMPPARVAQAILALVGPRPPIPPGRCLVL
jgi:3-oxoacyl-[acyl-carrier protein] reductase